MYDYDDYLEGAKPYPLRNQRRRVTGNAIEYKKVPAKPARFCECGQKLSIVNEGIACFVCTRKKK